MAGCPLEHLTVSFEFYAFVLLIDDVGLLNQLWSFNLAARQFTFINDTESYSSFGTVGVSLSLCLGCFRASFLLNYCVVRCPPIPTLRLHERITRWQSRFVTMCMCSAVAQRVPAGAMTWCAAVFLFCCCCFLRLFSLISDFCSGMLARCCLRLLISQCRQYSSTMQLWTWLTGSNLPGAAPVFGTIRTPVRFYLPTPLLFNIHSRRPLATHLAPARWQRCVSTVLARCFCLVASMATFAGFGRTSGNLARFLLFVSHRRRQYNVQPALWAWVGGCSTANPPVNYGTVGVAVCFVCCCEFATFVCVVCEQPAWRPAVSRAVRGFAWPGVAVWRRSGQLRYLSMTLCGLLFHCSSLLVRPHSLR